MKVLVAILVAMTGTARADDSFGARAEAAQRVHRIENVIWTLTAACDSGDDVHQRQCRHVRAARLAELAGRTLLVDGDSEAFDIGSWNAAKKAISFSVTACIRCLGVDVEGKTWYVVGGSLHPYFRGAQPDAGPLRIESRAFADEHAAKAWARAVGNARVELVVKVPAHPQWTDAGKSGLELEVVAWRVYAPCDGAIIAANPPSGPAPADAKQCIPAAADEAQPELGELTADAIQAAMAPVVEATHLCFGKFAVTGTARLRIHVLHDGTVGRYEQLGDFINTPTGACIDKAAAKLTFPASKNGIAITYPITAQP